MSDEKQQLTPPTQAEEKRQAEEKQQAEVEQDQVEQNTEQQLDSLSALREDIDEIDRSLLALLESRLELCRTLGQVKQSSGLPLRSIEREQYVVAQLLQQTQDSQLHQHLQHIFTTIARMSLEAQEEHLAIPKEDRESLLITNESRQGQLSTSTTLDLTQDDRSLEKLPPKKFRTAQALGKQLIKRNLGRLRWRKEEVANAPRSAPLNEEQRLWLTQQGFAHRGFHTALNDIPENSLPSFEMAIQHGYGIELDVHLSKDGVPMVFHDEEMARMTGHVGEIKEYTCAQLCAMTLIPGESKIPTLAEALACIAGRVPVLVEVKNYGQPVGPLESAIAEQIKNYQGPLAVQSFNPMSLKWFYRNMPRVIRGLIAYSFPVEEVPIKATTRFLLKNLLFTPLCKPHYIAYEHEDLARHRLRRLHRMRVRGTPVLVWTVRTQEHADLALKRADNIIFEGFHPQNHD